MHATSIYLDEDTLALLRTLAAKLGIGRSSVIRLAVRNLAKKEKVKS